jgi:hypothetical protein
MMRGMSLIVIDDKPVTMTADGMRKMSQQLSEMKRAHPVQLLFAAVALAAMCDHATVERRYLDNGVSGGYSTFTYFDDAGVAHYIPKSASDPWYAEHGWLDA